MTVGDLIKKLLKYDPELELKIADTDDIEYRFSHLWQWDNDGEEDVLNTYLTMTIEIADETI